jgi:hypothetical protein
MYCIRRWPGTGLMPSAMGCNQSKISMMKTLLLLIGLVFMCNDVFSQAYPKEYHLKTSKHRKTTALVFLATGTAAIITGILIEKPHRGTGNSQSWTGGLIEVGGVVCVLVSIPIFISAHAHKRRAAKLSLYNQNIFILKQHSFLAKPAPSISLGISI